MSYKVFGIIIGLVIFLTGVVSIYIIDWRLAIGVFLMIWGHEIIMIFKQKAN